MKTKIKQIILLLSIALIFTACDEEGEELITTKEYHNVRAEWYYYGGDENDIFTLHILLQQKEDALVLDTVLIGDTTFSSTGAIQEHYLEFSQSEEACITRMLLTNVTEADEPVTELDTMVDLRENSWFQFLKLSENDATVIYTGSDNSDEENPSTIEAAKYSFYYSEPSLPDLLKVVFYTFNDQDTPYYIDDLDQPARDSMVVEKGVFSDYKELHRISTNHVYFFQLKDAANDTLIQDIKLKHQNLALSTATGYSTCITGNNTNKNWGTSSTNNKFMTLFFYKSGSKYKDQELFSEEWTYDDIW